MNPLIENWHAVNVAQVNAQMRAEGVCKMHPTRPPAKATRVWHYKNGNKIPMCQECVDACVQGVTDGWAQPPVKIEALA